MEAYATEYEQSVLQMIAAGHTDSVVARHHNVGKRTLERQLANLMGRVGVRSRLALGAIAAEYRWINVDDLIRQAGPKDE